MTAVGDEEAKLVYIKRWRTIVKLPRKYADEIVSALRSSASAAAPKVRTSHHINKEETARLQGGKDAMDDQRDPDATRALRMEQFEEENSIMQQGEVVPGNSIRKLERDGKIAVLVAPGFGAGWSTWNSGPNLMFDPEMAQAVLDGDNTKAEKIANRKYPEAYMGGVSSLVVEWVPKGARFEIQEYDGNESLRVFGPDDGILA